MDNGRQTENALAIGLLVFLTVGASKWFVDLGVQSWYPGISLPSYAPSGQVIGVVWVTLYILWALALGQSLRAAPKTFWKSVGPLHILFGAMSVLWCYTFFSLHDVNAAAVTAGILAFATLALTLATIKTSKYAAALLVPLLLWVSFAAVLSTHIAYLNPPKELSAPVTHLPVSDDGLDENDKPTSVTFNFSTGVKKTIDSHLSLTLDRVNDSRCPADVQCIWQGEFSPEFTAILNGVKSQVRLGTVTAKEADVGEYHLTLIDAGLQSAKVTIKLP